MVAAGREGGTDRRSASAIKRRLGRLMMARLVLGVVLLGVALAVIGVGEEGRDAAERGLYATVTCTFVGTLLFVALHGRVRRVARFGAAQLATDVALVTALVHFSGGGESIFVFLYLAISVYGAILFGRPGAYGAASLGALAYGALLLARHHGLLATYGPPPPPGPVQFALWGIHAGAFLLVALLASALSRELDRAGRALDERTRDLAALRRLHARTVECLTSGLLTVDSAGRVTSLNPEAARITGWEATRALGRELEEVIPGALELVERTLPGEEAGGRMRAQLRLHNRRGEDLHLGLSGSILRDEEGAPDGHVVIFQDVTRLVDMERELRRRDRLAVAGRLAASLAHEIRNPLAAISGSLQVLERSAEAGGDPEAPRLMGIVLRETERLDRLIADFLQYARPAPPRTAPVRLAELVGEVLEVFEPSRPPSLKLRVDIPDDLSIVADAAQLRQLLWNLLRNAVDAMPGGGELAVEAFAAMPQEARGDGRNDPGEGSAWAEIRVHDTGVGISDDVVDRIFEPFFTSKPQGTGLGLATVHRIVEDHGGHLSVESVPGRGTTFRIRWPRAPEPA